MTDRFLRLPDVLAATGLSRRTIYRKMDAGEFPKSIQIAANAVAWRESDVSAWMQAPMDWSIPA